MSDVTGNETSAADVQPAGWQPIETAPKDGTPFLAFGKRFAGWRVKRYERMFVCFWPQERDIRAYATRGKWNGYYSAYVPCDPTHWMPLPDSPKRPAT